MNLQSQVFCGCFRKLCILILLLINLQHVTSTSNDSVGYDNAYLQNCILEVLDATITSDTTNNLRILLVIPGPVYRHAYAIDKAGSLPSDSFFRPDFKTVLYIHGFNDRPSGSLTENIVTAYLRKGNHNIILLDAESITWISYLRSSRSVRYIGNRLGLVLVQMSKSGLNVDGLTVIGHGLGAHMAGFAGKTYFKSAGKRLPTIVALDPSGPCFRNATPEERISTSDAEFVQVVHTNGGNLGLMNAVGHVDFYINGGRNQPWQYRVCTSICSHERAVLIWTSAVETNSFVGIQCNSVEEIDHRGCYGRDRNVTLLGPLANKEARGVYLIMTTAVYPYCIMVRGWYSDYYSWFGSFFQFFK